MAVIVAMTSLTCINTGFDNTISHAKSNNGQGIPQAAHKYHMTAIPYPFKKSWKHNNLLICNRVQFPFLGEYRQVAV